jgi:di/tricarboxylate transporter
VSDATLSLIVLAATVALFVWNRLSVGLVAVLSALALYAVGLVDAETAVAGFGDPVVVFIACLFVVADGLESSGVTAWAGRVLVDRAGTGRGALLIALAALSAVLAAVVTPNGAAAALLPVAVLAARRSGLLPAELLMPVAFAASAGALLLLSGSTVNVIVSDALADLTGEGFGYAEFALVGLPLVLVTVLVCRIFGPRLMPRREPDDAPVDLAGHVGTLLAHYRLDQGLSAEALLSGDTGVAEVVVAPRSSLVGQPVTPGEVRSGLTVLAVQRYGRSRGPGPTEVAEGDLLLLHGPWAAVHDLARDDDVLVVDDPELVRRQNLPLGRSAWAALGVLAVTVALLASGLTSPAVAGLVGAAGMVLTRVLRPQQVYRAVSWQTVVLIGGLIPLSVAIRTSGAADLIADRLVDLVDGAGPRALLAVLFLLTVVLGQVVSNTATVLVVTPIALSAAAAAGLAPAPVLMLVAVAGAASFLTPIATPANMIVMGPAGYRFGDYWRLGLVVTAAWFVVAVGLIPVVWSVR